MKTETQEAIRDTSGRFVKGSVANPNGRPKQKSFKTLVAECEAKFGVFQDPNHPNATTEELAVQQLICALMEGEGWAIKDFLDRVGYKPKDVIESEGGLSLMFNGIEMGVIQKSHGTN